MEDTMFNFFLSTYFLPFSDIKGTVMQIEKALISTERLSISKLSWKFRIPTIYNFAEI